LRPDDYGEKYPKWPGLVGLELEMLALHQEDWQGGTIKMVPLFGEDSLSQRFVEIGKAMGWDAEFLDPNNEKLLRLMIAKRDQISFEPGGQYEISLSPFPCLSDAL